MIDPMKSLASAGQFICCNNSGSIFLNISEYSRSVLINSQVLVVAISICVMKNDNLVLFVTGQHFQLSLLSQFVSYEERGLV
jgi:hypothetical protein